jgi:hypothetical protein
MIHRFATRMTLAFMAAAVLAALPAKAQSVDESPFCNNHLIRGTYGFTVDGYKVAVTPAPNDPLVGPQEGVAMTTFDGNGNLVQIDAITFNGVPASDFTHPVATGTYQVNRDCTGTFTVNFTDGRPPINTSFVVVEGGLEIDTVVMSVGPAGAPKTGIIATRSIGKRRFF